MKYFVYIAIIKVFLTSHIVFAQIKSDKELLTEYSDYQSTFETKRKVEYLFKGKNAFIKYNPISLFFGGALYLYQSTISKQIGANCPYEYNYSNFSKICIRKYGLVKGILLTADRLTRCTRMAGMDIDPYVDVRQRTHKIIDNPDDYTFRYHAD